MDRGRGGRHEAKPKISIEQEQKKGGKKEKTKKNRRRIDMPCTLAATARAIQPRHCHGDDPWMVRPDPEQQEEGF